MTNRPDTRYVAVDGVHIAYQVLGDGPIDIALHLPFRSPMDQLWEVPQIVETLNSLASFGRLILHDRRGTGESDPIPPERPPSLEDWVADTCCVMDAVGSEKAWLAGVGMGGAIGMLMAASYPERTRGLVLLSAVPRTTPGPDFPWGITNIDEYSEEIAARWGTASGVQWRLSDPEVEAEMNKWVARNERHTASPSGVRSLMENYWRIDVTDVLPSIQVPCLVVAYQGDYANRWEISQYLAERIPGATFHGSPTTDFFAFSSDRDETLAVIQEFVTGTRPAPVIDRVLATVLFTDIVDSTRRAAELGDAEWRSLLDRHDHLVDDQLHRFGGKRVKHTGDGILATFDGPARAIRCAQAIAGAVSKLGIDVRAGVHTGEIERRSDDISGIAVHIGQRVSSMAGAGEVLVSRTVTDLVAGSGLEFEDRGDHELKGVPGRWRLYAVKP